MKNKCQYVRLDISYIQDYDSISGGDCQGAFLLKIF